MSKNNFKEISDVSQLNINDLINIFYYGNCIKENCLITNIIHDHYFVKGLIVYLNGNKKETIDLENQEGLWIKKIVL